MKVLIVDQHFYPEQFQVNDISFQLVKDGYEVEVLTGLPNYPSGVVEKEYKWGKKRKEIINGVTINRSWLIARGNGKLKLALNYISFMISSSLKALFLKKNFDIIMVYQTSPVTMAMPAVLLKLITKKPLIIYCFDLWPESISAVGISNKGFIYKVLYKLSRWIYSKADEIFISSKLFENYFREHLKLDNPITYLPAYADNIFETMKNKDTIMKTEKGTIDLLFAGNIGKMQSVDTIIYAANDLKKYDNIKWHIVGDGSEKERCEELVSKLGLSNVIFYGKYPLKEMPKFYKMADAFLVTMKKNKIISYTLPNKVQSYMASGKPIIGAIDGETQIVINEANCGLCVPAEDHKGLSNIVKKFIDQIDKYDIYSKNARVYYQENFLKTKYINKLKELFERIVKERNLENV